MVAKLFLGFTLIGSQWVLWFLLFLSIVSVALILERWLYLRKNASAIETSVEVALKDVRDAEKGSRLVDAVVTEARLNAEKRLGWLATIGSNAPFIGLFGTVLGIIRAFHDLSTAGPDAQNSNLVSAGISEALVATAVGLFVAIPAVVAYNLLQRSVKEMVLRADKRKNQILGRS